MWRNKISQKAESPNSVLCNLARFKRAYIYNPVRRRFDRFYFFVKVIILILSSFNEGNVGNKEFRAETTRRFLSSEI